jgi:hypothetical protein
VRRGNEREGGERRSMGGMATTIVQTKRKITLIAIVILQPARSIRECCIAPFDRLRAIRCHFILENKCRFTL